jgi:hypothetical protein
MQKYQEQQQAISFFNKYFCCFRFKTGQTSKEAIPATISSSSQPKGTV